MKQHIITSLSLLAVLVSACAQDNSITKLAPLDFQAKLNQPAEYILLDVRTPEEYSNGHIQQAQNFDWNGDDFDTQIASLDKSVPVFVYCLSGGRSSAAAQKLHQEGFSEVYELDGGMMNWRGNNLPETTTETTPKTGMTKQQFDAMLDTDKVVLVDFYAEWCKPCQKMEPYLAEISVEMADSVVVIRIDADKNPELCKTLEIDALPVLQVYKNKERTWTHTGFVEKAEVISRL